LKEINSIQLKDTFKSLFSESNENDAQLNNNSSTRFNQETINLYDDYAQNHSVQEIGFHRTFTDYFKQNRDATIGRYVVQTNKILTTLDKLISIDLTFYDDEIKRDSK
jgi:hypothetical protein